MSSDSNIPDTSAILHQIKRAIKLNLDDKAYGLIKAYGSYLSRRDVRSLVSYMREVGKFPTKLLSYIYNISPYSSDVERCRILELACKYGYADTVQLLVSNPIMERYVRKPHIAEFLIKEAVPKFHWIPLSSSSIFIVKFLLGYDTYRSSYAWLLNEMCQRGEPSIVRLILSDPGFDLAADNNRALSTAISNGRTSIVQMLLADSRTDPNYDFYEMLYDACYYGHVTVTIVEMLLSDPRVDVDLAERICAVIRSQVSHLSRCASSMYDSLKIASSRGHCSIVKLLLQDERIVKRTCYTVHPDVQIAFNAACSSGEIEVVKLYLNHNMVDPGASQNCAIISVCDSPSYSSIENLTEVAKILMADPRVDPSDLSNKALDCANRTRKKQIVELLLTDQRVLDKAKQEKYVVTVL